MSALACRQPPANVVIAYNTRATLSVVPAMPNDNIDLTERCSRGFRAIEIDAEYVLAGELVTSADELIEGKPESVLLDLIYIAFGIVLALSFFPVAGIYLALRNL